MRPLDQRAATDACRESLSRKLGTVMELLAPGVGAQTRGPLSSQLARGSDRQSDGDPSSTSPLDVQGSHQHNHAEAPYDAATQGLRSRSASM